MDARLEALTRIAKTRCNKRAMCSQGVQPPSCKRVATDRPLSGNPQVIPVTILTRNTHCFLVGDFERHAGKGKFATSLRAGMETHLAVSWTSSWTSHIEPRSRCDLRFIAGCSTYSHPKLGRDECHAARLVSAFERKPKATEADWAGVEMRASHAVLLS